MLRLVVLSFIVAAASAQHHVDPFAGSGCDCASFCSGKCAINATPAANMTLYRMTPKGVLDMSNKDTGGIKGDTSFVLSKRTSAYECRKDPNSFLCNDVTQFDGDDKNSTDLVISFTIELDGQWGPYLPCNPVDIKKPLGPWACTVSLGGGTTPKPPQCKVGNYSLYKNACWKGIFPKTVTADTAGDCCAASASGKYSKFTYFAQNKTCLLYKLAFVPASCAGGEIGYQDNSPPPCNCSRVHKTVGREDLTVTYAKYTSMHPAGGIWYSHPEAGECKGNQRLGDDGCTWRVAARNSMVKASCVYGNLDDNVESFDKSCFSACPVPKNVTSDCYLKCYTKATTSMTHDQLTKPWALAFASEDASKGGCPVVKA